MDLNDGIGLRKVGGKYLYMHDDTPCITEAAARRENLEEGQGMREVLCRLGLQQLQQY